MKSTDGTEIQDSIHFFAFSLNFGSDYRNNFQLENRTQLIFLKRTQSRYKSSILFEFNSNVAIVHTQNDNHT